MTIRKNIDVQRQWPCSKYGTRATTAGSMLVLLLMMLWARQSLAQTLYGSVVGNVTDSTGAAVVGAAVTATQVDTGAKRVGDTNEKGIYNLSTIPSGLYRIVISKSGFQDSQTDNVTVGFNAVARVDAILRIGTAQQTVTVNAETAELQTDRADVNHEVGSKEFLEIPQPTRTYQGLLANVPGVLPPGISANGTVGTNNVDRAMSVQANGTSQSATDVRIEGVSAAQPWVPYRSSLTPSVEAIQSVSMVTGTADASQTLSSGATINVQLKSGTNQFHGSGYIYHIDNLWAARPYFLRAGALPKNIDNDYGGTVGGPILKNKLFFFASYEGDYTSSASQVIMTVPTAAMLAGDFTATGTCTTTSSAPACTTLYDPTTGNPDGTGKKSFISEYGSNKIPASMISKNVQPLLTMLAQYPPASTPPTAGSTPYTNNYSYLVPKPQRLQKWDTKIDWDATSKLRVTGRYNYHPYNLIFPSSGPAYLYNITASNSHGTTTATTIAATYVATKNLVIDGAWGFTRSNETINPPFSNVKYGSSTLGISGVNLAPLPIGGGIPNFNFLSNTYTGLGYNYPYLNYKDATYTYTANGTLNHGPSTIKFGFLMQQQHVNHIENAPDSLTFGGNSTILNTAGAAPSQFNSFADFLLGLPSAWTNSYQVFGKSVMNVAQYALYLTNTQQVNKSLTVNYGTSWSYFPVPNRGSYGLENLNLNTLTYAVCGYGGVPIDCGIKTAKDIFGPHVGLVYRVTPSFVARAGFSIAAEQFNMARDAMYNYPESIGYTASAINNYVPVGSLSTGVPTLSAPNYQQGIIPLPKGATFTALPQNIQRGYVESYNLTLEKEVGPWLAQVGYVGDVSVHQHTRQNINYGLVGQGITSGAIYKLNGTTGSEMAILPLQHTNYNSLQVSVQHRFSKGYQLRASYTYSKWLGLCCDVNGFGNLNIPIPEYINLNYAVMPGDRKHDLAIAGVVESPFGAGKAFVHSGLGAFILGGWQLNAQQLILSGPPFSVSAPGTSLNAPGSIQRADQVKSSVAIHPGSIRQYFDTSAFAPVTTPRFGTASYDSLRAPGAANLDASLFRSFAFRERYKMQLRMEAFNVTNSPHFSAPNSTVGSASIGKITSTTAISRVVDSRYFRFGAKFLF